MKTSRIKWARWRLMIWPQREYAKMWNSSNRGIQLFVPLLSGIMLVHLWADFFNLGDSYETGQVLSGALILGPLTGIIWPMFAATALVAFGNLFDPSHKISFRFELSKPPLPLWNLLWKRVFGENNLVKISQSGLYLGYQKIWSWLPSTVKYINRNLISGRSGFGDLYQGLAVAMGPFLILGVLQIVELKIHGEAIYLAAGNGAIWLLIKLGLLLWFFILWIPLARQAFGLNFWRALGTSIFAFVLSFLALISIFNGIFGVPILGT